MVSVNTNLNNFSHWELMHTFFGGYSSDYVYTAAGIFRLTVPPLCPQCGTQMNHNGYNTYGKKAWVALRSGDISAPLVMNPAKKTGASGKA